MNKASQNLINLFEEQVAKVGQVLESFPFHDKETYASWLTQTYYLVRHSTRFLTLAAAYAPLEDRDLHYDMIHHLKGELHHDQVAYNDIKALGFKPEDFPELLETSMLYQTQYYWLEHYPVSSVIGYALLLEGIARKYGPLMIDGTKEHGKKTTAFIRLHAEVDIEHYADGLKSLEKIPTEEHPWIIQNLMQSTHLYLGLLAAVQAGAARPHNKIAA